MKLTGAQVCRCLEELARFESARQSRPHTYYGGPSSCGDTHRAMEDFVTVVVEEILTFQQKAGVISDGVERYRKDADDDGQEAINA